MRHTIMQVVALASLCLMASVLAAAAQPLDATRKGHTQGRLYGSPQLLI